MTLKIWVDTGLISLTGSAAYWLGSQPEIFLAHQPASKVIAQALEECKGVEEVTSAVAQSVLSQRASTAPALTLQLLIQEFSSLVQRTVTPCRLFLQELLNEVQQWEKTAGKIGLWVLSSELIWNFLSHLSSARCMADDMIWACVRGGVCGALAGAKTGGSRWKQQMVFGAVTGCGYGFLSSTMGMIAGKSMSIALTVLGCEIDSDRKWGQILGAGITAVAFVKNNKYFTKVV